MKVKEQTILNREQVPISTTDWFTDIRTFYAYKHSQRDAPIFSCNAAEKFPKGWQEAFQKGTWNEEGEYGDNFRNYFGLDKA